MMENREPVYNQVINDCIYQQGIDKALAIYSNDEVEHHIGGQMHGAKVVEGSYVIEVRHFENKLGATWEQVEPILELFKKVKSQEIVGAVLTNNRMVLQLRRPWFWMSSGIMKKALDTVWANRIQAEFYALKSLPWDEALLNIPSEITGSELIGRGFAPGEVVEYRQAASQKGLTVKEIVHAAVVSRLVMNELNKIGVELKGGYD